MMDFAMPYCGETNKEDPCATPWDYCCEDKKHVNANSLVVELQGADGKAIATPSLPDLRLLDGVKVTGKLVQDEHGNHLLLATGLFRTQRPTVGAYVKWPQ
jgi:hypothetical protein